ncbi:hypothetical protein F4811DRAFT_544880 [Daldinia bambusicola]|nr:hypothetical protein F4811DRAFT_544880 [Daldinia bambusicola]
MEVEFLSNMRYGLLTSKEEWEEWLEKLACFHEYYERAVMEEKRRNVQPPMPMTVPSPTHTTFSPPLPSPTNMVPSTGQNTMALASAYSPSSVVHAQNWNTYHPTPTVSPLAVKPSLGHPLVRKRGLEGGDMIEPAAKRVPHQSFVTTMPPSQQPQGAVGPLRLPVPHLTLDTSQAVIPPVYQPQSTYPQTTVSLPPLGAGMKAMSTVYPATTGWAPQGSVLATSGPQMPSYGIPSGYGTPTKRPSPTSLTPFGSSPLAESFGNHTPTSNSPLVYLQQRASPYKPVRRVNTLLNPPPSIPLSQYHLGSSQMHYQPLGRRYDLRSGIVPEFLPTYTNQRPLSHPH